MTCLQCGVPIPSPHGNRKYCGQLCAVAANRAKAGLPPDDLPSGTTGALHEMVVACDLIRRGWHVFRALSPSCPCDLIAYREGGSPIRFEVRTSKYRAGGGLYRFRDKKDAGRQDIYADVTHDGVIHYDPSLDIP